MTNYTLIQNDLITSSLSDGAFRLLILLQSMCYGKKTECFPSQQYLSEKLHKSIRTIQRYIKELVTAKHIKIKHRGSISNLYTILAKAISTQIDKTITKVKNAYEKFKNCKDHFNNYSQRDYLKEYGSWENLDKLLSSWEDNY